jgi:hypothetical protein
VTLKNKYIILNDTGMPMEYKQKGTPDPTADVSTPPGARGTIRGGRPLCLCVEEGRGRGDAPEAGRAGCP